MKENDGLTPGQQYLAIFGFIAVLLAVVGIVHWVEESEVFQTEIAPKLAAMLPEARPSR